MSHQINYDKLLLNRLKAEKVRESLGIPKLKTQLSPFRYPGGKSKLSRFLAGFIISNGLENCTLIEPFCGGAGGTLPLLEAGLINKLVLNDINPKMSAFWEHMLNNTEEIIEHISNANMSISEWKKQRSIYFDQTPASDIEKAFSAFYMNRTNRSGILHAGPIGGQRQSSHYSLDCRFNKPNLIKRIQLIASMSERIEIHCEDARNIISRADPSSFIYADPPYVKEGKNIYREFCFSEDQHHQLSDCLKRTDTLWLLSYDEHPLVHKLYSNDGINVIELSYAINRARIGRELLIASSKLTMPCFDISEENELKYEEINFDSSSIN